MTDHVKAMDVREVVARSLHLMQLGAELHALRDSALATSDVAARRAIVRRYAAIASSAHDLAHDMPTLRAQLGECLDGAVDALRMLDGIGAA